MARLISSMAKGLVESIINISPIAELISPKEFQARSTFDFFKVKRSGRVKNKYCVCVEYKHVKLNEIKERNALINRASFPVFRIIHLYLHLSIISPANLSLHLTRQ
jgi:hypothetical protein